MAMASNKPGARRRAGWRTVWLLIAGLVLPFATSPASAALLAGVEAVKTWNLIVFNNATSSSEVEGRSFIGGSLSGNSSNYNIAGTATAAGGVPGLTVVGDVTGGAKNLNNGSGASVGGNVGTMLNLNGGTQTLNVGGSAVNQNLNGSTLNANLGADFTATLIAQRDLLVSSLTSLSANLAALASTATATAAANTLTIDATAALNIFNISAQTLSGIGQISVTVASGSTTIINVSGTDIVLDDNFLGAASELGQSVIWNFYEAQTISVQTAFYGTILAPTAAVTLNNFVEGTLVASSLVQNGEVHLGTFQGDLSSVTSTSAAPEPATWAMLVIGFGLIGGALRFRPRPQWQGRHI
jgi:choice-of-anchor A domain-containing protein